MELLEMSILEVLYSQIKRYGTSKSEILFAWRNRFNLKRTDRFYQFLHQVKTPSPTQHEFLTHWITKYWKYHFGENNFDNEVARIREGLNPYKCGVFTLQDYE